MNLHPLPRALLIVGVGAVLFGVGCGSGSPLVGDSNRRPGDGGFAMPSPGEPTALPVQTRLYSQGPLNLETGPVIHDAIWAAARCRDLIAACVRQTHSPANCVTGARACTTETPWREPVPCCPTSCRVEFERLRAAGLAELDAMLGSYGLPGSACFPGVSDELRSGARRNPP